MHWTTCAEACADDDAGSEVPKFGVSDVANASGAATATGGLVQAPDRK